MPDGFAGALAWEAVRRRSAPPEIPGWPVEVVAAIGIVINRGGTWLMRDGHAHDLNRPGAFLHLMGDAAVSLAAVIAGLGMLTLGWSWLDPVTALLVGAVVAIGAFGLLRESSAAAMDAVPRSIDESEVRSVLLAQPGVHAVHHLHIWSFAGEIAMTAHLVAPTVPATTTRSSMRSTTRSTYASASIIRPSRSSAAASASTTGITARRTRIEAGLGILD